MATKKHNAQFIEVRMLLQKLNDRYKDVMEGEIGVHVAALDKIKLKLKDFSGRNRTPGDRTSELQFSLYVQRFHESVYAEINTLYSSLYGKNETREFIKKLDEIIDPLLESLADDFEAEYNLNRSYSKKGPGSRPFLRAAGRMLYKLTTFPGSLKNIVNRKSSKKGNIRPVRLHTVYFRDLIIGYIIPEYAKILTEITSEFLQNVVKYGNSLYKLESELINTDYKLELKEVEDLSHSLDLEKAIQGLEQKINSLEDYFSILLDVSGTVELSRVMIRQRAYQKTNQVRRDCEESYAIWQSTFYAFYEDWRFRERLMTFISLLTKTGLESQLVFLDKIEKNLLPLIDNKKKYLSDLEKRIPDPDLSDYLVLKKFYASELYKYQKESRKSSESTDLIKTGNDIIKRFQLLKIELEDLLVELPEKSGVVKEPDYEKGIRKSEIFFFSPREYIEYDCLPSFMKELEELSENFSVNYEEIKKELSDFDQITDFTIDTSISLLTPDNASNIESVRILKEGLSRSIKILERISMLCNDHILSGADVVSFSFKKLAEQVYRLDDNDNILLIFTNLLKSKALEEARSKRKAAFLWLSSLWKKIFNYFNSLYKRFLQLYHEIRRLLKIDKASTFVSSDISNFLSDINKRIFKLPVIYRYLFENTPVKEQNLFLSRDEEIKQLDIAIQDWKAGNYAATLIIGENGSGKTSLIQHYIKNVKGSYQVSYMSIDRFYHSRKDYYELIESLFNNENLDDDQKVEEYMLKVTSQRIVIIDGLERVFLRKPNGFDCLNKLLTLIVSTNTRALWICMVSLHAGNYLQKTIALKEHFDYIVELNSLSTEQIQNIVLKRNRLSGFLIHYLDEGTKNQAKTGNTRDIHQQLQLQFFSELNKFADSNISLSLYFWLGSIIRFKDNELFIKKFSSPDFSFLETLSAEKVYTLLLIILHGKVSVDSHAEIYNQEQEKSYRILTILKEDSIVLKKGDYYILNGILYRHVVQLLKSRNLIH